MTTLGLGDLPRFCLAFLMQFNAACAALIDLENTRQKPASLIKLKVVSRVCESFLMHVCTLQLVWYQLTGEV